MAVVNATTLASEVAHISAELDALASLASADPDTPLGKLGYLLGLLLVRLEAVEVGLRANPAN